MKNKSHRNTTLIHLGLLQAHIDPFMSELRAVGYAAETLKSKQTALGQFLRWRERRMSRLTDLTEFQIRDFLERAFQGDKSKQSVARRALYGFANYLRDHGVVSAESSKPPGPGTLPERYASFLRHDKGLAELSLKVYLPVAEDLLRHLAKKHRIKSMHHMDAVVVRSYLMEKSRDRSFQFTRLLAASLRSFLRFLHAEGEIGSDLAVAIPTVRRWDRVAIPKTLTPADVERVLAAPDQSTATGRRDFAILLLLARLGLRSSEVLLIELDDLRWSSGEILIRGKGCQRDVLPLPKDVGAALSHYLRTDRADRGLRKTRRVFLRTIAPRVALRGPASIGHIVRRAMAKAAIPRPKQIAAHLFRHTLASRMLQQGARLTEISQVLRHRDLLSTETYAKIDRGMLQEVVRPWPAKGDAR